MHNRKPEHVAQLALNFEQACIEYQGNNYGDSGGTEAYMCAWYALVRAIGFSQATLVFNGTALASEGDTTPCGNCALTPAEMQEVYQSPCAASTLSTAYELWRIGRKALAYVALKAHALASFEMAVIDAHTTACAYHAIDSAFTAFAQNALSEYI